MDALPFAQAFQLSPLGMAFLRNDGVILSANRALGLLVRRDSLAGARVDDFLPADEQVRWAEFFQGNRAQQACSDTFQSSYLSGDDRDAWWSIRLSCLDGENQRRFFVVFEDETVRRIDEQKLREACQLAEGASRAKSEFLANMSHEIRTPLFTITGMTDLLRLGELKLDQAHHAGQIASAAQHLLELVNDVLDFSKIEAGQMSLESIPIDLDDVVGRSLEVVSLSAYRKGLELVLDLDPTVRRHWLGDPSRLRQVLVNLLSNAVKFTHKGRITLVVEPGPTFRVRDTGIGISEAARQSLFRVFTQADSSTTRQYGGTGLGLAISQRLVGLLGGRIEFTSVQGKGTEFFFSIELAPDGEEPAAVPPFGTGREVLVVDNDPGVREVLTRRLTEAGFAVRAVGSRAQAHKALKTRRPDVVLIDQELGAEDGWQLASEVRAEPSTADLPLVLMSLLRKTLEPSPRYPADLFRAFVDKPINTRSLIDLLGNGLEGRWSETVAMLLQRPLAGPDAGSPAGRLRILVAEDHEVNRELFRLLLVNLGHQVILVENGREACDVAVENRPQLVFMDLQMPVMNGYEAAAELRRQGLACPIVAVTASALKGELERCQSAGMNGILTKPFTLETLDSVVQSYAAQVPPEPEAEPEPLIPELTEELPGAEVFSREEALRVFLGNEELLGKMIDKFLDQTRAALSGLDQSLADFDAAGLGAGAHAIKGSAANITARTLSGAAAALEAAVAEGKLGDAPARIAAIRAAFRDFEDAVTDEPEEL